MRVPVSLLKSLRGPLIICLLVLVSALAQAQTSGPVMLWPVPQAIPFSTALSSLQLNAEVVAGPPVLVPLGAYYNDEGFKTLTSGALDNGYDAQLTTMPSELFGSSASWRGITFPFGATNEFNAVSAATIPLPAGSFAKLLFLGSMVDNFVPPGGSFPFIVTYTDGTSTTFERSMSDWVNRANHADEENVMCVPYRYFETGVQHVSVCLYGYELDLDPTRIPASLTLPATRCALMVAAAMDPPSLSGDITYSPAAGTVLDSGNALLHASFSPSDAGTLDASASVPIAVTPPANPIVPSIAWPVPKSIAYGTPLGATQLDAVAEIPTAPVFVSIGPQSIQRAMRTEGGTIISKGFDNRGNSFPASELEGLVQFKGAAVPILPPLIVDAATSTTIPLPPGSFTSLLLVASAAGGPQRAQAFTIQYADGTSSLLHVDLSPWNSPQDFSGETIVATTDHVLDAKGNTIPGSYHLYGYELPLDSTRSPISLTLPVNPSVVTFAVGLEPSVSAAPAPGSYIYTPSAGTFPYPGNDSLSVTFEPSDAADVVASSASNQIAVSTTVLQVVANPASRVYGAADPAFSGAVFGVVNGDQFTESFSTNALPTSSPGTYAITPSVSGPHSAFYSKEIITASFVLTPAPVTATATTNGSAQVFGQNVAFTVSVISTTTGTPTGAVQFTTAGMVLGTAPLVNGIANFSTASLPVGVDEISLQYSGDIDFQPLTLASAATVTIAAIDFTLTSPVTVVDLPLAGSATLLLNIAPNTPLYQSDVTFAAGPSSFGVGFSPSVLPSNAGPRSIEVTLSAPNAQTASIPNSTALGFGAFVAFLLFPITRKARNRRRVLLLLLLVACGLFASATLTGCGSGFVGGTFPLTLTATDSMHTHTVQFSVRITPPK